MFILTLLMTMVLMIVVSVLAFMVYKIPPATFKKERTFSPGPSFRGVPGWTLIAIKPRLTLTGIHDYRE
jgi:hypothetical protein